MFKKTLFLFFCLMIHQIFMDKTPLYAESNSCVFCRQQLMEEQSVFETQLFWILIDIEPRVKGHLLVVPKRHIAKAQELLTEEWAELAAIIPKIAHFFTTYLGTDQYILIEKNGRNAFQRIPHVHFHLLPIHKESWGEIFDPVPPRISQEEIEQEVRTFRDYFSINLENDRLNDEK